MKKTRRKNFTRVPSRKFLSISPRPVGDLPIRQYVHSRDKDGGLDSTCMKCFSVVGTNTDELSLLTPGLMASADGGESFRVGDGEVIGACYQQASECVEGLGVGQDGLSLFRVGDNSASHASAATYSTLTPIIVVQRKTTSSGTEAAQLAAHAEKAYSKMLQTSTRRRPRRSVR